MPNPENLIGKGFKDNPENINKNGRPRKSFASINKSLEEKGIKALSKTDLLDAYGKIFNSDEEELRKMSKDKTLPYAYRLIIGELNDSKTRSKALADYRDYMFGKAQQNTDVTSKGKAIKPSTVINYNGLSEDTLSDIIKNSEKPDKDV